MTDSARLIAKDRSGFEVWAQLSQEDGVLIWELFASRECEDYLGCADSLPEAKELAQQLILERRYS